VSSRQFESTAGSLAQVYTHQANSASLAQTAFETSHTLKPLIYAVAKNKLLLRLSNMEDSFDHSSAQVNFDVNAFAHHLFKEANPNHSDKV